MAHMAVQLFGYVLSIAGLCALIFATFTNDWKVIGHGNDNTALVDMSEGLWMKCSAGSSSFQSMCISYGSILYQSGQSLFPHETVLDLASQADVITEFCVVVEIQVGRSMMIISIVLATIGVLVASAGLKCTRCLDGDDRLKEKVVVMGGSLLIISGLCGLVVTSWFMYEIISDFYERESKEQRYVLGRSLITGFVAALLCLFGGTFLSVCSVTRMTSSKNVIKDPASRSLPGKDYV